MDRKILDKIEVFVDKTIPYLIIVLLGIVIIDVFYHELSIRYANSLFTADSVIISFFAVDLIFKYQRVKNIPRFLRLYWIDIIAVFPFFLLLRLFEEILLLSERSITTLRSMFHAGLIFEEEVLVGGEAARTLEIVAKESRLSKFTPWLKPLRRLPRLMKAFSFFEHPKQKKTLYHKQKLSN